MNKDIDKQIKQLSFGFFVFCFILLNVSMILTSFLFVILRYFGVLTDEHRIFVLITLPLVSITLGTHILQAMAQKPIRLILEIINATKRVADGDYTVRIDTEQIYAPSRKEFYMAADNFNFMVKELENTEMFRNDFIENVSHEFKTPLSSIEGYTTLLQSKNLSEDQREEYIHRILTNTRRLSSLSSNILLLSRLDHQDTELSCAVFPLDEQIREIILNFETQWENKEINLDLDISDIDFYGNCDMLNHVWENLLENAIKFTPQGGRITISLISNEDTVLFSISDNGVGMTPETQSQIFKKFYQGDTSRSTKGNGLGLPLVKQIVDLHHGKIAVNSILDHGTAFTVSLPIL